LEGTRKPSWKGRWLERVIVNGEIKTVHRKVTLGTKKDYPTERLARRALNEVMTQSQVNDLTFRPRPVCKFDEFASKWKLTAMSQQKLSCMAPIRSRLAKHVLPVLANVAMKDISAELLQSCITNWNDKGLSAKTVKNIVADLSCMWNSARTWKYVGDANPYRPALARSG
jgi:hypothetical protein